MSFKLVDQALALRVSGPSAKFLLILIASHARDDGTGCIAGQERLADLAGISERTCREAMASLTAAGLIRRRQRFREDGTRTSDETMIAVDTTGRICRWSTVDHRQKTTETTGKKRPRPPAESAAQNQSEESLRGIGQRESAPTRNGGAKRAPAREPKPAALSDPGMTESWKTEARAIRPDLTDQQVEASMTVFRDHVPTGQQTPGRWRNWIRNEDPNRRTERGKQRDERQQNAARLFGTDYPHEATDQTIDPATVIDSTCRAVPD